MGFISLDLDTLRNEPLSLIYHLPKEREPKEQYLDISPT